MVANSFLLVATSLLVAVKAVELGPVALDQAFQADACPKELGCAEPHILRDKPIYEFPPEVTTIARVHHARKVHEVKSTTYLAKVETTIVGKKGICEKLVPTTIKTRPTVTVWVDTTTTSHFYSVTDVETEYLTTTHKVIQTSACFKEIGPETPEIAPPKITPPGPPFRGSGGHKGGVKQDILKAVEKEVKDKALKVAFPEAAAAVEIGKKIEEVVGEESEDEEIESGPESFVEKAEGFFKNVL